MYNEEREKRIALEKEYDKLTQYFINNTIAKDTIRNKINKYKNMLDNLNKKTDLDRIKAINERIIVLKEILGE